MSIRKLLKISPFVILTLPNLSALASHAHATEGGTSGGGGDASEARVNEIRADILNWIQQGGAAQLQLSEGISLEQYVSAMVSVLGRQSLVVGFVTTAQENQTDNPELKVIVNGQPKTCRGFISTNDQRPHMLCNVERFAATSPADQYRLVHHEYAGLAGIEQNLGAASDYAVSTQLTQFLVPEIVMRLAVLPRNHSSDGAEAGGAFGRYQLVSDFSINHTTSCSETLELRDLDDRVAIIESTPRYWAYSATIPKAAGTRFNRQETYDNLSRRPTVGWSETLFYNEVAFSTHITLQIETGVFHNYGRTAVGRAFRRNELLTTNTQRFEYNTESKLLSYIAVSTVYSGSLSCIYRRQ